MPKSTHINWLTKRLQLTFLLIYVGGLFYIFLNVITGRYIEAVVLACGLVVVALVYAARHYLCRFGYSLVLNLALALAFIHQVWVLDINRDETNIGVLWFIAFSVLAMLLTKRWQINFWQAVSLAGILFTWYRVTGSDVLWQHDLTLPNLFCMQFLVLVVANVLHSSHEAHSTELIHAIDKAEHLSERSQVSEAAAQAASIAKSRLLATLSHELRSPMQAVSASSELLLRSETEHYKKEMLATLHQNSDVLVRILDEVLDLAKLDAGHEIIELRSFSLHTLIDDVGTLFAQSFSNNGLMLIVDVDPELPEFWVADDVRVRQVLLNLLSNAVKYTPKGSVLLRITQYENQLSFVIQDTGIGIAEQYLDEVFKPFIQLDTSLSSRPIGVGLGLAISKELVQAMGGQLFASSTLNVGSQFEFRCATMTNNRRCFGQRSLESCSFTGMRISVNLQNDWAQASCQRWLRYWGVNVCAAEEAQLVITDTLLEPIHSRSTLALLKHIAKLLGINAIKGKKENISTLKVATPNSRGVCGIVDDNVDVRLVIARGLEHLGYSVLSLSDGESAVAAVIDGRVDVLLLDQHMPGLGGIEVVEKIRSLASEKNALPVCMISGNGNHEQDALAAGANYFMVKPARIAKVASILEQLFDHRDAVKSRPLCSLCQ